MGSVKWTSGGQAFLGAVATLHIRSRQRSRVVADDTTDVRSGQSNGRQTDYESVRHQPGTQPDQPDSTNGKNPSCQRRPVNRPFRPEPAPGLHKLAGSEDYMVDVGNRHGLLLFTRRLAGRPRAAQNRPYAWKPLSAYPTGRSKRDRFDGVPGWSVLRRAGDPARGRGFNPTNCSSSGARRVSCSIARGGQDAPGSYPSSTPYSVSHLT
jgi:hypothetical protein